LTLVDTNVLIYIATRDPIWFLPAHSAFAKRAALGKMLFVDIVYAEFAAGFTNEVDCADVIDALAVEHSPMSRHALWIAGDAFRDYRRRGGPRTSLLGDFLVGAQARAEGLPVLTFDARRYRTYFPDVELIVPSE
jgi:predicted nucleic acid-binding protein